MTDSFRMLLLHSSMFFLAACIALYSQAESQDVAKHLTDGATAMNKQDYKAAQQSFTKATEIAPSNGQAWGQLGLAYHFEKEYDKAIVAYKKAIDLNSGRNVYAYNVACAYSLKNDKKSALVWLAKAVEYGFKDYNTLSNDSDLNNIRKEQKYADLALQVRKSNSPCSAAPFRQFDFWIGNWVVSANGQRAGINTVEVALNDCVLIENWTGSNGMMGKSINRFNPRTGKWHQSWVDDTGNSIEFVGELVNGEMRFSGEGYTGNGQKVQYRMSFTPNKDGSVRQLWQSSGDGKSWSTIFDGLYTKKSS